MKHPLELWVYLSASSLLWLTLTLCAWIVATQISMRLRRHPLANPVLISIVLLSSLLVIFDVPYARFLREPSLSTSCLVQLLSPSQYLYSANGIR